MVHRLLERTNNQSLVQLLGGFMQVGDLVRDITGAIGIVKKVSDLRDPKRQFVKTTFGWVRRENLQVLS